MVLRWCRLHLAPRFSLITQ
uniref:Uncharacterized protein n=1 Tax=Arundo donax TaxID=35708 RepID=A0A0A9BMP6_ARUDO